MAISTCLFRGIPTLAFLALLSAGCASGPGGEYHAEARLAEGREESALPGYSLAEMRERLEASPQSLVLNRGGRFIRRTVSGVDEGAWRVEGDRLVLREDTSRGIRIQPSLQVERNWRLGPGGEIVDEGTFRAYNIEIVYRRR